MALPLSASDIAMKKYSDLFVFPLLLSLLGCGGETTTTEEESASITTPPTASVKPTPVASPPLPTPSVSAPVGQQQAATQNSFWAVNQHLDQGGTFYLYLSSEQLMSKMDNFMETMGGLVDAAGQELGEEEQQMATAGMDMVRTFFEQSGIRDISGMGMSSFEAEKDFHRNSMVVHHYPERKDGLLWKVMGAQPHEQQILKMLPTDTVLSVQADLDAVAAFDWMRKFITDTAPPEAVAEMAKGLAQMNQAIKFEDLLRSTGGELGFFVTLNEQNQIPVPLPLPPDALQGLQLTFSEPGLALVLKVKDQQLMTMISQLMQNPEMAPMLKQSVENGITIHTLTPPEELPVPIDLTPTLMQTGDYIVLTSSQKLAKDILAVQSGKSEGLAGTEEFKRLANGLNLQGNQLHFMSSRLGKEYSKLSKFGLAMAEMQAANDPDPQAKQVLDLAKKFMDVDGSKASGQLTVMQVTAEGMVMKSQSTSDPIGATVPLLLVGGGGIAASMLLPALASAKSKANAVKSQNNLRQLYFGLSGVAANNDGQLPTADKWCDVLLPEIGAPIVFVSPLDSFTLDLINKGEKASSYAMNAAVAGKSLDELNPKTILLFEADLGWNGTGGLKEAEENIPFYVTPSMPVVFADGSSAHVPVGDLRLMRWTP